MPQPTHSDATAELALIRLLADGERHSGSALAAQLGISRAAVCKAVHKAAGRLGLELEAVRGRGYRLAEPLELLDPAAINAALTPAAAARIGAIEVLAEVDSTNSHLLRQARASVPVAPGRGLVCMAERQHAGRGRLGRTWIAPFGGSLALSMLWRLPQAPAELGGLSLAAGVAVVQALVAACGMPVVRGDGVGTGPAIGIATGHAAPPDGIGLKWPNDVHWRRRKLAGLLLEVSGEAQGPSQVVLGLGLNLRFSAAQGAAIDQPWVDLAEVLHGPTPVGSNGKGDGRTGPDPGGDDTAAADRPLPSRNGLAAALIGALALALDRYGRDGFGAFRDDWLALDLYRGEAVALVTGDRQVTGTLAGIDHDGALLLATADGERRIVAGEVSLSRVGSAAR